MRAYIHVVSDQSGFIMTSDLRDNEFARQESNKESGGHYAADHLSNAVEDKANRANSTDKQ